MDTPERASGLQAGASCLHGIAGDSSGRSPGHRQVRWTMLGLPGSAPTQAPRTHTLPAPLSSSPHAVRVADAGDTGDPHTRNDGGGVKWCSRCSSKRLTQNHCAKLAAGGVGGTGGRPGRPWGRRRWERLGRATLEPAHPDSRSRASTGSWSGGCVDFGPHVCLGIARRPGWRRFQISGSCWALPIHPRVPKSTERRLPRALVWLLG